MLMVVGAIARIVKGVTLCVASWADEICELCLGVVTHKTTRDEWSGVEGSLAIFSRMAKSECSDNELRSSVLSKGVDTMGLLGRQRRKAGGLSNEARVSGCWVVTDEGYVAPHVLAPTDLPSTFAWSPSLVTYPPSPFSLSYSQPNVLSTVTPISHSPCYVPETHPVRRSPRFASH